MARPSPKSRNKGTESGSPKTLSDRQRLCWLTLIRIKNVDPATFRALSISSVAPRPPLPMLSRLAARGEAWIPLGEQQAGLVRAGQDPSPPDPDAPQRRLV